MADVLVNVDNFARAESDRMFASMLRDRSAAVNEWSHLREPTPIDQQTVIRMNRDTLYSFVIADISERATLSIPDAGGRYLSVMVVNQDHYINRLFHEPGEHELTVAEFETPYVCVAARVLVDPEEPADLEAANAVQDGLGFRATSARPFVPPDYDEASQTATRQALLELARGGLDAGDAFGRRDEVDPVHHLIATAAGWGGLPEHEAKYVVVEPKLPVGEYALTVKDVPVDAFWSISLYNADGFFEPNERNAYSVNNITAAPNEDGSITVHLGGCADERPNCLPIMEGWNYAVRLYRPRPGILDGSWTFPSIETAE